MQETLYFSAIAFGGLSALILSLYIIWRLYLTWNFQHWIKRKIPGPKPLALYGTFPGMVDSSRNFIYDLDEVYRNFKNTTKFVGVFVTRNPQLLILDPELCKRILITDFKCFQDNESSQWMKRSKEPISGSNPFVLPFADWKVKRAEIAPGLTISKIKAMFPIIQHNCEKLKSYLNEKIGDKDYLTIDAKQVALQFTADVVADVAWGIEAGNLDTTENTGQNASLHFGKDSTFLEMSKKMIAQTFNAFAYYFYVGLIPIIRHFYYVRFFPEITDRFFLKLTRAALENRNKNANMVRNDLLQYLVELQQKKSLTDTEIVAHMLTFLFDGFETSATLISHCLLLLARNPETLVKLRQEIQEYWEACSGVHDFDELIKLPYLDQCLAETLRIFTPLPFMAKICTQPCELVNNDGVTAKTEPGDICLISLHSIHHDEDYYPQPEEFMPERFDEENGGTKKYKDMGVYLPFGDGPRICIGMKFGLAQTKAAIVEVIKHFDITVNERTRKDNCQAAGGFLTGLDGGIFLNIKKLRS